MHSTNPTHEVATHPAAKSTGRVRYARMRTSGATVERMANGAMLVRPEEALEPYPRVLTDRVAHWAAVDPGRPCAAKRDAHGNWRRLSYGQVFSAVRSLAQAFLDRGLSADRPVAILSENDLEHLLVMLAGQHAGIPTASISTSYSLVSADLAKLRHSFSLLTPGLVFSASGERFARAIEAVVQPDLELVVTHSPVEGRRCTPLAELLATTPKGAVEDAHAAIDPDSPAKFLFTSGSTDKPKAVINTHRMLCSNQQMICQVFRFLQDEPPVIVDWMPWNHTFGGNHDIGVTLYNGGTFYIDDGKAGTPSFAESIRNLREISTTVYFGVPRAYEDLLTPMRTDETLRRTFFARLRLLFYAAAGMSQHLWDAYRALAEETCGERIIMATGLGATETAPMAIQTTWETDHAGIIGIPVPGVELKLAPRDGKLEARVRGPSITPGYWRQPELTARAFDEDGFYKFGDAIKFVDPADVNKGFVFDGRFAEDFKLSTGTWVSVGPLRTRIMAHFAPLVRDVVIAGHDRDELAMMIFANLDACRALCPTLKAGCPPEVVLRNEEVRSRFRALLRGFALTATGSSTRVTRALLMEEPPSLDGGEITDKGSLNQRNILERRAALVEELYLAEPGPQVLRLDTEQP
ncbi:MAG TPA: feruloyl-CoA synthase [Candidatus Nitrosotalea sp.]|nr:feruloyl-CoA synthase [Candidatus Nitrosotalea sp.]